MSMRAGKNRYILDKQTGRYVKFHYTKNKKLPTIQEKEAKRLKDLEYKKKHKKEHIFIIKDRFYKKKYGIGIEQVRQMWIVQGGKCAICNRSFVSRKNMTVDHNHTTGQVRQLLCSSCNYGIGVFHEDVSALRGAIDYLNKWSVSPNR